MGLSVAVTTTPVNVRLPVGDKMIVNSSTGDDVYMLSPSSTSEAAAFTGNAAALIGKATGLVPTNTRVTLGGNHDEVTFNSTGTALLSIRIGTAMVTT